MRTIIVLRTLHSGVSLLFMSCCLQVWAAMDCPSELQNACLDPMLPLGMSFLLPYDGPTDDAQVAYILNPPSFAIPPRLSSTTVQPPSPQSFWTSLFLGLDTRFLFTSTVDICFPIPSLLLALHRNLNFHHFHHEVLGALEPPTILSPLEYSWRRSHASFMCHFLSAIRRSANWLCWPREHLPGWTRAPGQPLHLSKCVPSCSGD